MKILKIDSLKYLDETNNLIECRVFTNTYFNGVDFTASKDDLTEFGKEIYTQITSGIWGNISPYVKPVITPPTFEELKAQKIKELSTKYDANFNAYLSQYPKGEQDSFQNKASEAKAYMADNTAPTPYISAMVGGDETKRIAMINAVWAKVQFIAQTEGQMIATRDAIKACTTQKELDAIQV